MAAEYKNAAQERGYRVILALAGNEFDGLAPGELAKLLGTPADNITRDLAVLKRAGLAERIEETGRWRLGPKLVQIALAFSLQVDSKIQRMNEIKQRYTRLPE